MVSSTKTRFFIKKFYHLTLTSSFSAKHGAPIRKHAPFPNSSKITLSSLSAPAHPPLVEEKRAALFLDINPPYPPQQ